MTKPKHRQRTFVLAGKIIRARANNNPHTQCWRCGETLATCGPHHNGTNRNHTPATWDCGHLPDGNLAAECSPCNRSNGAIEGNRNREPHSGWLT